MKKLLLELAERPILAAISAVELPARANASLASALNAIRRGSRMPVRTSCAISATQAPLARSQALLYAAAMSSTPTASSNCSSTSGTPQESTSASWIALAADKKSRLTLIFQS